MAARKTPPPRKPGTKAAPPTRREVNTKKAGKLGYDSVEAMKSVQKFYNSKQSNVTPSIKQLEATMVANGWGKGQTGTTPVMIGGMRWLTGQGKLTFTGERSDAAKKNPGAAWGGLGAGGEMPAPGAAPAPGDGGLFQTGVSGATGAFIREAGGKGPAGDAAKKNPGAAWSGNGAGSGGVGAGGEMPAPGDGGLFQTGVSGATGQFIREAGGAGPAGDAAETSTTKTRAKFKKKAVKKRAKAKNLTISAKKKKSPGGIKVTMKERAVIRKTKPNPPPKKVSSRITRRRGK